MTGGRLAWNNGTPSEVTEADWAAVSASFLGAGFRFDLPGADRHRAARHERGRVERLAQCLGSTIPTAVWDAVVGAHPGHPIEIEGGWARSYTSEAPCWIAARPVTDSLDTRTAAILPTPAHPRPSRGFPTISLLADQAALRAIDAEVGIWVHPHGEVVTSTAGPVIAQRPDGTWALGSDSQTWLARAIAAERGAGADLTVEDLRAATFVGVVRRALGVMPLSLPR